MQSLLRFEMIDRSNMECLDLDSGLIDCLEIVLTGLTR